jgi:hypothetical protein
MLFLKILNLENSIMVKEFIFCKVLKGHFFKNGGFDETAHYSQQTL